MNVIENLQTYAEDTKLREKISDVASEAKAYAKVAISAMKKLSHIDLAIYTAVAVSFGALISSIFSKTCKKLIAVFATVCGLGTLYFIYKKYFKD